TIYIEDTDDAEDFTENADIVDTRAKWTDGTTWIASATGTGWKTCTDDFAAIIQHLVDRPGWATGQDCGLILWGNTGAAQSMRFRSYEYRDTFGLKLHVEYTEVSCSEDISNTPDTWSVNGGTPLATSTDYWAKGSAPTFPLDDSECTFTVTNNSGGAVDITIKATDFTGGVGWTLAGTASTDTVVMKAGKSGDALEANMVTLTTSFQSFISSLADSATKKWELMIESATSHTDGAEKTSTVTASATCS
ncbi:unnamed protein product, partial [marine sediment metagenome]